MVVSSVTPLTPLADARPPLRVLGAACAGAAARMTLNSSESAESGSGTAPAFSNSAPLWTSSVASPPSSRIMFGPSPSGQVSACSVHHQYSSSVSPFQANTGMPAAAIAAAAWSWVEKMLQRRPAHLGAERDERLDQHRGLDRHVERAHDRARP